MPCSRRKAGTEVPDSVCFTMAEICLSVLRGVFTWNLLVIHYERIPFLGPTVFSGTSPIRGQRPGIGIHFQSGRTYRAIHCLGFNPRSGRRASPVTPYTLSCMPARFRCRQRRPPVTGCGAISISAETTEHRTAGTSYMRKCAIDVPILRHDCEA